MKKRLTERIGDGIRYTNGKYNVTCYPKNNNLTPVDELAAKLCEFEDKIENGTLLEIPCKIGENGYLVTKYGIVEVTFDKILLSVGNEWKVRARYFVTETVYFLFEHFGKTVFLTREEAEAALAESRHKE